MLISCVLFFPFVLFSKLYFQVFKNVCPPLRGRWTWKWAANIKRWSIFCLSISDKCFWGTPVIWIFKQTRICDIFMQLYAYRWKPHIELNLCRPSVRLSVCLSVRDGLYGSCIKSNLDLCDLLWTCCGFVVQQAVRQIHNILYIIFVHSGVVRVASFSALTLLVGSSDLKKLSSKWPIKCRVRC